jgi:hypothetical protein
MSFQKTVTGLKNKNQYATKHYHGTKCNISTYSRESQPFNTTEKSGLHYRKRKHLI